VRHWARSLCATQAPQEFGNSRKDVLLIGTGLLVAGFGSYYAMLVRPIVGRALSTVQLLPDATHDDS